MLKILSISKDISSILGYQQWNANKNSQSNYFLKNILLKNIF